MQSTASKSATKAPRQSNIELLRIIAMVLIVAHHFAVHSDFSFSADSVTLNRLWIQFLQLGGKIGVNIFVIISGYFLVSSTKFKTEKAVNLWLQIFTYSFFLFCFFVLFGIEPFGLKELVKSALPITTGKWWFASTYFVLYLFSPFLNRFLVSLEKTVYQRLLVLMTILWCIMPTFLPTNMESNDLLWFVYLYMLAGYLRLHMKNLPHRPLSYCSAAVILSVLVFLSAVVFDLLGTKISFFSSHATFFYAKNKLPILLISLTAFIGALQANIKHSKMINIVSSATFGVYLLHENNFVRPFIWKTVFQNPSFAGEATLIPYSLMQIFIVFVVCTSIELLRLNVLEKRYAKATAHVSGTLDKLIEKFFALRFFEK